MSFLRNLAGALAVLGLLLGALALVVWLSSSWLADWLSHIS